MANLIVDIGNTAVKASWSEGMTIGKTYRYQGERVRKFILSLLEKEKPEVLVISSAYEIPSQDEKLYKEACGALILLDSAHTQLLKENDIPEYLSCDRAASIIASRHLFEGKPVTVVDFGTTIAVDFLDKDGKYESGTVSLGVRSRLKAINRYSRSLPLIEMPEEVPLTGDSFESSIAAGVISGIKFEIEGYLGLHPDNIVIFTGGDSNYFVKRIKKSIFAICNLVLLGLALIADEYVRKNK
ncbi:MAG: type III pantothenate kinase [Bacteroidales bacterium]|nr:type III pantothenate kinase [Bacteroidales bacterium]